MNPATSLTALLSKAKDRPIAVYDLESKDGDTQAPGFTRVFLAGFFDGKRYKAFRNDGVARCLESPWDHCAYEEGGCIDRLLRHVLTRPYRGRWIYAHNGGAFDHLHLLPWLTAHVGEFRFEVIPMQSAIQILRVTSRKTSHAWTFLDSIRLFPMGLDQAAKTFGFEGKLSHDLSLHEDDPKWEAYLRRDCEALYESVSQYQHLVRDRLGGEMGVTSPSTAMKLYRRRYMGHGQAPAMVAQNRHFPDCRDARCEGCLHAWIRRGYCGGRTERYRKEGRHLSYYDANSMYPHAMLSPMPAGEVECRGEDCGPAECERYARDHVGFVECEVEIPATCYLPPLPWRDPKSSKLLFPVGRFSGVWDWAELSLLDHPAVRGRIVKVKRSAWFETEEMFTDYVKELYAFRDKNSPSYDEGLAAVSKLMMNSLCGKFGMQEDRREILVLEPGEAPPEGATFPETDDGEECLASRVCYVEKRVSPPYVIPQISAHITSLARARLWTFMQSVLDRGGRLYYCDTDSLITDLSDLPCSSDLGELKNEYPGEVLDVQIAGPKMYVLRKRKLDGRGVPGPLNTFQKAHKKKCTDEKCPGCAKVKIAMKGVPKEVRTPRSVANLQRGRKVHFRRLDKLGAMAARGFRESPKMRRVFKSLRDGEEKRVFLKNGNSVPRVLGREEEDE